MSTNGYELIFRTSPKTVEMVLNESNRTASVDGVTTWLTKREFAILSLLAASPGRVVQWSELLGRIWGSCTSGNLRALRVWVHSLRHKLEPNPSFPAFIMTVWGHGLYLNERVNVKRPERADRRASPEPSAA